MTSPPHPPHYPFSRPPNLSYYTLALAIALALISSTPACPEPVAIGIAQEATLPGWYTAKACVESESLYGRIAFRSGDKLPPPESFPDNPVNPWKDPELRYWTCQARPIQQVAITAGSLAVSGLPSRAKNPFFTLSSPRYTPLKPDSSPIIKPGSTTNTDNLGIECATRRWTLAAEGDPEHRLDEPAWLLLSRRFDATGNDLNSLSLTTFYGAKRLDPETGASWFLDDRPEGNTAISMPGAELAYAGKRLSVSATAFASFGPLIPTGWLIRSDCSLTGGIWSVAGGYARSNPSFTPLDGIEERLLERAFLAPSITVKRRLKLAFGGIVIRDRERRERYYEDDRERVTSGGFLELSAGNSRIETHCMADTEGTELSSSLIAGKRGFPLSVGAIAKTTLTDESESILEGEHSKASAGITFQKSLLGSGRSKKPQRTAFSATLAGEIERNAPSSESVHSGSLSVSMSFSGRHGGIKCHVDAYASDGSIPWKGAIGLETMLR